MGELVLLLCGGDADFFWDGIWFGVGVVWAVERGCLGFGIVSPQFYISFRELIFEVRAN